MKAISIIENFIWKNNEESFSWIFNGKQYQKEFKHIPKSVVELADSSGFAVVGSFEEFGMHNTFIFNADGSERHCLAIPVSIRNAICFHEIYYIDKELTAIIATKNIDFACVIDGNTGLYKRTYETR